MADWATLKIEQSVRKRRVSFQTMALSLFLGVVLARGAVLNIYPFGLALGAALILKGGKGAALGLLGIVAGTLTLHDLPLALESTIVLVLLGLAGPLIRRSRHAPVFQSLMVTALTCLVFALALLRNGADPTTFFSVGVQGVLAGGFSIIYGYALNQEEALWRGEFNREQGMAWLLLLIGAISGLQGLKIAAVDVPVVVLSFFVLFAAERFGPGTASGVGALLGFLPELNFNAQNLMDAGIFGLAGFCTGAFQRFGKLGIGLAFSAVTLSLTVFLRQEAVYSQLVSSGLGLLLFLLWPGATPRKDFLKPKPIPEVEATVSKVKVLAEIFDQIALSYQAAEAETANLRPEIPELMNVLVERVCQSCPTIATCWEREFYKTYRYLFDLFSLVETHGKVRVQDLPVEWKRQCGRLKEMLLGIQFIMEQEKSQEAWRRRLGANQEAIARQFQSVSHVIGNLAKELNARHNRQDVKPSNLARRRRHFLDVGVASFSKSGSGINGDNYASLAFSPNRHAFVICDGMGVGENAAKMSAMALTLLEQLMNTGFDPVEAVQALNSMLVLRSPEESFVTVDMAILALETDELTLIKAGAVASYIAGPEGAEALSAGGLPAGILDQIEVPVLETVFKPSQVLVMVSDGIPDAVRDGGDWLKDFLGREQAAGSQELADKIVREVRRLSGGEMQDDGVVLVVRKNFWNEG
ncbi:stage II sporulation protein E [Peptococcaceae bacterium CEB3]|nr:stage II sporulation protein E [Peptococcaceae bacterium CEB3]